MDLEPLASKVSFGCASNAECVVVSTSNKCQACGAAPVWYGLVDYFTSSTEFSADQYCKTCDAAGPLPCVPPGNAVCDNGQCIFAQ
jgi:hypothetical protein